ncbi:MAG: DnaJ domain-containing protein [Candidatus Nitrosotenuis sp.]
MEPHKILGIGKYATPADIKTAFRRLAAVHHPDKGGDENDFKRIRQAYEMMMNSELPALESEIVVPPEPPPNISRFVNPFDRCPFRSAFDDPSVNYWEYTSEPELEELNRIGFETQRLNVGYGGYTSNGTYICNITLEQAYSGATIPISVPNYKPTTISIHAGINNGDLINVWLTPVVSWLSPGSVPFKMKYLPHPVYRVAADNSLERDLDITWLEAVTGGTRQFRFLDNSILSTDFKGPVQSGTSKTVLGYGMQSKSTSKADSRDNYLTLIFWVKTPDLTKQQIEKLKGILDE